MKITGTIKRILEVDQVNDSFKKQEFDIVTDDQYPQIIRAQLVQEKIALLDSFNEGDSVQISINLKGREWTNPEGQIRVFNTVEAWKIDKL